MESDSVTVRVTVRVRVRAALPHLGGRVIGLGRRLEELVHLG